MAEPKENTTEAIVDNETIVADLDEATAEELNNSSGVMDVTARIEALNDVSKAFYSSVVGGTHDSKTLVAKAMLNSEPFDENIGRTINLKDVIVLPVDLKNKETGEVQTAPRVLLIDDTGLAFNATSIGVMTAITAIFAAFGEPGSWTEPVAVQFAKEKGNNGFKYSTLKIV